MNQLKENKEIKTATLWKKTNLHLSQISVSRLDSDPWIVQPFEIYEEIRIEEIIKKHKK